MAVAVDRLGRSAVTLKRMHARRPLPVVFAEGNWLMFESFIEAVVAPLRPGEIRSLEDVAAKWFAARNSAPVAAEVA